MILKFLNFIGKIIFYIVIGVLAIPFILYTIILETRKAATKHPDRLKLPLGMEWEIGDIHYYTYCMCLSLFWGDGKVAKLFQKIRILRGEILPDPDNYWIQAEKDRIELAKVLYEEYRIGDGTTTTIIEVREKEKEQKKILGQIIILSEKRREE